MFHRLNGAYSNVEQISTGSKSKRIQHLNGLIVSAHINSEIRFYRISDYGLERTFVAGSLRIFGFSEIDDGSLLAAGGSDTYVRIFSFDGSAYSLAQAIDVGSKTTFVKLSKEKLICTGYGGKVSIYQSNGTHYLHHQSIQTSETIIYDMHVYPNMSGFIFGGDSGTFSIYEFADGIYELMHQQAMGESVWETIVDSH